MEITVPCDGRKVSDEFLLFPFLQKFKRKTEFYTGGVTAVFLFFLRRATEPNVLKVIWFSD